MEAIATASYSLIPSAQIVSELQTLEAALKEAEETQKTAKAEEKEALAKVKAAEKEQASFAKEVRGNQRPFFPT
jgi:hypothetical protein